MILVKSQDSVICADDWARLTTVPNKPELYIADTGFREGYAFAQATWGAARFRYLQRTAMLTIRPDGLAADVSKEVFRFLEGLGFGLVWWGSAEITSDMSRRLSHYQHNMASLDRIQMMDEVWRKGASLVLVMVQTGTLSVPASNLLSAAKGSAFRDARSPDSLRARIDAHDRLLTFIHCPDEPADVARELAIVHSEQRRREIATAIARGIELQEKLEWPPMNPPTERLISAAEAVDHIIAAAAAVDGSELEQWLALGPDDQTRVPWCSWAEAITAIGMEPSSWTSISAAARVVQMNREGHNSIIRETGKSRWRRGEGTLEI